MKCKITGKETTNKWKGIFLCKDIIELAKLKVSEHNKSLTIHERHKALTLRDALVALTEKIKEKVLND